MAERDKIQSHKLGCEFPARDCICEYLLTKQLRTEAAIAQSAEKALEPK